MCQIRAMKNREEAMADFDELWDEMGWQPVYDDWADGELEEIEAMIGVPLDRADGLLS